jgi:hypothetical protein
VIGELSKMMLFLFFISVTLKETKRLPGVGGTSKLTLRTNPESSPPPKRIDGVTGLPL